MRASYVVADRLSSFNAYLASDHQRLDAIFDEVSQLVQEGHLQRAAERFQELEVGLSRHIRFEEDVLFPIFEERTGIKNGPTAVMRREHVAIRKAVEVMAQALERDDAARFREGEEALVQVLAPHNHKEERVVYPMLDEAVSEAECRALLERLERAGGR
jgi:regulator of cell morphogenesis and NO signaling